MAQFTVGTINYEGDIDAAFAMGQHEDRINPTYMLEVQDNTTARLAVYFDLKHYTNNNLAYSIKSISTYTIFNIDLDKLDV